MPLTNIKISINEYMRMVDEDVKKAGENTVYGSLLSNLSQLAAMTQYYFGYNTEGKLPVIDEKGYDNLIKCYSDLAKDCNSFLAEDRKKSKLENKRINMIKRLVSYVEKDIKGLVKADKTKENTLSDIIKNARVKTIDLTGKKLGSVGGALNSRIPLKSVSGKEGFFTKKLVYSYSSSLAELNNEFEKILPQEFLDGYHNQELFKRFQEYIVMYPGTDINSEIDSRKESSYRSLAEILYHLKPGMQPSEAMDYLKANKSFAEKFQEYQRKVFDLGAKRTMSDDIGVSDNTRMDQRNSAMSDVAFLLGMSGIIAKAVPMNVIIDGQVIEGTFMEKAAGEDLSNLSKDSLALQADEDTFNNPAGLKQLADLQVIDYICGNVDRHSGNIIYQFEKDKDGKVVLAGICGIDNDASFGTKLFDKARGVKEIAPLPYIKSVSVSCYESLKVLSADSLKLALADKLKKEEIDALCQRIENLMDKINKKEINLIPDNAWGKDNITFDQLTSKPLGIPMTIKSALKSIKIAKGGFQTLKEKASSPDYAEGKDVTDNAEARFKEIFEKLEEFAVKSEKMDSIFHKNSVEYENMLKVLDEARTFGGTINEKLNAKEDVELDVFKEFAQKVVNLGLVSQQYMKAKNVSQYTDMGKDRFALAAEMRDLAQENFAVKETAVKEDAEPNKMNAPEEEMNI